MSPPSPNGPSETETGQVLSGRARRASPIEIHEGELRALLRIAIYFTKNESDAEDLVQDVIVQLLRGDRTRDDGSLSAWLRKVLKSRNLDRLRRQEVAERAATMIASNPAQHDADSMYFKQLVSEILVRYLPKLPKGERLAFEMVDVNGSPLAEVAAILGVELHTIENRRARAKARLRALLTGSDGGIFKTE